MDVQTCVFGKLYRKKLVLCNRGKIAFKVQAEVPPEFDGCLEFGPDMGFVNIMVYNDNDGSCQISMAELQAVCSGATWPRCRTVRSSR